MKKFKNFFMILYIIFIIIFFLVIYNFQINIFCELFLTYEWSQDNFCFAYILCILYIVIYVIYFILVMIYSIRIIIKKQLEFKDLGIVLSFIPSCFFALLLYIIIFIMCTISSFGRYDFVN